MYNNEIKDDFQNFQDQWCEDWIEDWHEVWYDDASFDIKQTSQGGYKAQPTVNEFKGDSELEDAGNHHSFDEEYEYTEDTIDNDDHQDKTKSSFLDYVDELESALNTQTHLSESSQENYNGVNPSLDVVISMD